MDKLAGRFSECYIGFKVANLQLQNFKIKSKRLKLATLRILIGASSTDIKLSSDFTLQKGLTVENNVLKPQVTIPEFSK